MRWPRSGRLLIESWSRRTPGFFVALAVLSIGVRYAARAYLSGCGLSIGSIGAAIGTDRQAVIYSGCIHGKRRHLSAPVHLRLSRRIERGLDPRPLARDTGGRAARSQAAAVSGADRV